MVRVVTREISSNLAARRTPRHPQSVARPAVPEAPATPASSDLSETARFAPPHTPYEPVAPRRPTPYSRLAILLICPLPAKPLPVPGSSHVHLPPKQAGRTTPRCPPYAPPRPYTRQRAALSTLPLRWHRAPLPSPDISHRAYEIPPAAPRAPC